MNFSPSTKVLMSPSKSPMTRPCSQLDLEFYAITKNVASLWNSKNKLSTVGAQY